MYALGEVPEVEQVVGLGRGGEEVCTHAAIDLHAGSDYGFCSVLDWSRKLGKEPFGDGLGRRSSTVVSTATCDENTPYHQRGGGGVAYLEDGLQADL